MFYIFEDLLQIKNNAEEYIKKAKEGKTDDNCASLSSKIASLHYVELMTKELLKNTDFFINKNVKNYEGFLEYSEEQKFNELIPDKLNYGYKAKVDFLNKFASYKRNETPYSYDDNLNTIDEAFDNLYNNKWEKDDEYLKSFKREYEKDIEYGIANIIYNKHKDDLKSVLIEIDKLISRSNGKISLMDVVNRSTEAVPEIKKKDYIREGQKSFEIPNINNEIIYQMKSGGKKINYATKNILVTKNIEDVKREYNEHEEINSKSLEIIDDLAEKNIKDGNIKKEIELDEEDYLDKIKDVLLSIKEMKNEKGEKLIDKDYIANNSKRNRSPFSNMLKIHNNLKNDFEDSINADDNTLNSIMSFENDHEKITEMLKKLENLGIKYYPENNQAMLNKNLSAYFGNNYKEVAVLNSLYEASEMIELTGKSIDDFLNNPVSVYNEYLDKTLKDNVKNYFSKYSQLDIINNIFEENGKEKLINKVINDLGYTKAIDMMSMLDDENIVENRTIAKNVIDNKLKNLITKEVGVCIKDIIESKDLNRSGLIDENKSNFMNTHNQIESILKCYDELQKENNKFGEFKENVQEIITNKLNELKENNDISKENHIDILKALNKNPKDEYYKNVKWNESFVGHMSKDLEGLKEDSYENDVKKINMLHILKDKYESRNGFTKIFSINAHREMKMFNEIKNDLSEKIGEEKLNKMLNSEASLSDFDNVFNNLNKHFDEQNKNIDSVRKNITIEDANDMNKENILVSEKNELVNKKNKNITKE